MSEAPWTCPCGAEIILSYTPPSCPACGKDSGLRLGPVQPEAEAVILHIVRYWFHYNGLTAIPEWSLEKLREACRATLVPLKPDPRTPFI